MNEGERKTLQQSLRDTWMNALGVLSGAESEVTRAAQRLLESIGLHFDGEPNLKAAVHDLVERVRKNRDELERRVDEGVRATVSRLHRPIQQEIDSLRVRLEQAQQRIETLTRKQRPKS